MIESMIAIKRDWLSSGEYEVVLWIKDIYDESQKHPLMRNFYDTQIYNLDFTVS